MFHGLAMSIASSECSHQSSHDMFVSVCCVHTLARATISSTSYGKDSLSIFVLVIVDVGQ